MSILIGLIRHARTEWNDQGRIQGRTDIPITDAEAERLEGFALPPRWREARLIASPLSRARRTARLIGGYDPEIEDRLIEMNFGDWEGAHGKDLILDPESGYRHVTSWSRDFGAPNGERIAEVEARVLATATDLAKAGRDALLVCHMGVMRAMLAHAHHWPYLGEPPFKVKRDRIYALRVSADGAVKIDGEEPERLIVR